MESPADPWLTSTGPGPRFTIPLTTKKIGSKQLSPEISVYRLTANMEIRQQSLIEKKNEWNKLGVIADKPKFPQYASLSRRLETFKKWPTYKPQEPYELAESGFAYTGVGDAVRCYHCGNGLRNWEPDDSPWNQHAIHFPTCGHLRQCKGDAFIRRIRGETDIDTDGECERDDETQSIKRLIESNEVAVLAAKEFDMTDSQIEAAMKYFLQQRIEVVKGADLINTIGNLETMQSDCVHKEDNMNTSDGRLNHECDTKQPVQCSDDQEENDSLKEQLTCKICFDARACIITIPCGHMVTCPQCIGPLNKCCICRTPIEGTVRAFLAGDE